jgi:hypothetical protein
MSTTAVVAIVGVVSTPVVALAGYWFNDRRARADRTATRELTTESHTHERELRSREKPALYGGFSHGRGWVRTSDLPRVKRALSR